MTRRQRWTAIIDANLGYLFRNQGSDGRILDESVPSRSTVQAAHAALWAFLEPGSRHFQSDEALAMARRAVDLLVALQGGWRDCPFTPSYFGETLLLLERIQGRQDDPCREALHRVLAHQRQTGHHTFGHFSDWDILYALSQALGWQVFGDAEMKAAAAEHARLVWASVVPGGEGFYYLISPYQYWPPSVNYTGISTATFARYHEVSGDPDALAMVKAVKDYFLYYTEPWGLTEFTASPWHKHPTDTKEDTFAFVAASAEFLAGVTGDGRLDEVCEIMLRNLESMVTPDGGLQRRLWECAWINQTPYDPNTTAYLCHAADWCRGGRPAPLPDGYVSERRGINGFKARAGDFGYSVVCGESYVSLCGAWAGRDSLLQEAAVVVTDEEGRAFGQMAPLWRRSVTRFPDGFAQTAYYQPAQIIGDSWGASYSPWRVYQTYLGTMAELVGVVSLESLAEQRGRSVALDLHLGPAGQMLTFGRADGGRDGQGLVATDNSQPLLLTELSEGDWVQYGRLGVFLLGLSGEGLAAACWDAVAGEGTLHAQEFSSMVANDLVISCATPDRPRLYPKGARYGATFAVAPVDGAGAVARSGRYAPVPTGAEHTFAVAIDQGWRQLILLVAHHPMVRPVLLERAVRPGAYRVRVYAEERALVLKEFTFEGSQLRVEVATVSPGVMVEVVPLDPDERSTT